jgi:ankyrin repeat protein
MSQESRMEFLRSADLYQCDTRAAMNVMHWSCQMGFLDVVKDLITLNFNFEQRSINPSWTALQFAIYKHNIPIIQLLLDSGANPNVVFRKTGKTALERAAEKGHDDYIQLLLNDGVYSGNYCPLQLSCNRGHTKCVEYMLRRDNIDGRVNRLQLDKIFSTTIVEKIKRYKISRRKTLERRCDYLFKDIPTDINIIIASFII